MSVQNNCTLTVKWPLPSRARVALQTVLKKHDCGFSDDWDEAPVNICDKAVVSRPAGLLHLFARDVSIEAGNAIVACAKKHGFSVIVHTEWWNDYESDSTGNVLAFDATDGRTIDVAAGAQTGEPLIAFEVAMKTSRKRLYREYALPADLKKLKTGC